MYYYYSKLKIEVKGGFKFGVNICLLGCHIALWKFHGSIVAAWLQNRCGIANERLFGCIWNARRALLSRLVEILEIMRRVIEQFCGIDVAGQFCRSDAARFRHHQTIASDVNCAIRCNVAVMLNRTRTLEYFETHTNTAEDNISFIYSHHCRYQI